MINTSIKKKYVSVVRITLMSHDYKLLDKVLEDCIQTINLSGGYFSGPVVLPNRKHLTTVLTSPHVYKTALEQFAITIHKRILDVFCAEQTMKMLQELNINGGVEIKIAVKRGSNND